MRRGEDLAAANKVIGYFLRKIRRERGQTQEDIAFLLGVSTQQIQKYEAGRNSFSAARLLRLSECLDVPPTYFLGAIEEPPDDLLCDLPKPKPKPKPRTRGPRKPLTKAQRNLLIDFQSLTPAQQSTIKSLIRWLKTKPMEKTNVQTDH